MSLGLRDSDVSFTTVSRLHAVLEDESPMPYLFDIVDYTHSDSVALKEYIDRVGISIFERQIESEAAVPVLRAE